MTSPAPNPLPSRLDPLDAIRFVAALFVALFHGPKFPGEYFVRYFALGWDMLFFGAGMVMIFFVISGICIHYPVAASHRPLKMAPFLVRRYIRILPPVLLASLLAFLVGLNYSPINGRITWSLLCEIGYYSMYPALLAAAGRIGWGAVTILSIPLSYLIQLGISGSEGPLVLGVTMVFKFLPCWTCGCWVAESMVRKLRSGQEEPAVFPNAIWLWRLGIVLFYTTVAGLSYYKVIYYAWFLVPFSLLVAMWLEREVLFFRNRKAWAWLTRLGLFSYTLYLMHEIAHHGFWKWQKTIPDLDRWFSSGPGPLAVRFFIVYGLTALLTYLFAKWVEWPSQSFARVTSRRMAARGTPVETFDPSRGES